MNKKYLCYITFSKISNCFVQVFFCGSVLYSKNKWNIVLNSSLPVLEWDQFWNGICLRVMIVTYMITNLTCRPFVSERKLNIFIRSNFGQNCICPRQGMPLGWKKKPHFTTENSVLKYIWCKNPLRPRLELKENVVMSEKKKKCQKNTVLYMICLFPITNSVAGSHFRYLYAKSFLFYSFYSLFWWK